MSPFLSWLSGKPQEVRWRGKNKSHDASGQTWVCNPYLNAIFHPQVNSEVLHQVKLEYGRSPRQWLTWAQRLYVEAATRRPFSTWLASGRMLVSPGFAEAFEMMIMGGNHRFRLLWPRRGKVYVVAKPGFPGLFWQAEFSLRSSGRLSECCAPPILEIDKKGRWFCEPYLPGSPQNRLARADLRQKALQETLAGLRRLAVGSSVPASMEEYGVSLLDQVDGCVGRFPGGESHVGETARQVARRLYERIVADWPDNSVNLCQTHGDFQPGNILWSQGRAWLVDWEYSAVRQSGFDLLTWALKARSGQGIRSRLAAFLTGQATEGLPVSSWPGVIWTNKRQRAAAARLFLLEELTLRCAESAGFPYKRVEPGLLRLLEQLPMIQDDLG